MNRKSINNSFVTKILFFITIVVFLVPAFKYSQLIIYDMVDAKYKVMDIERIIKTKKDGRQKVTNTLEIKYTAYFTYKNTNIVYRSIYKYTGNMESIDDILSILYTSKILISKFGYYADTGEGIKLFDIKDARISLVHALISLIFLLLSIAYRKIQILINADIISRL